MSKTLEQLRKKAMAFIRYEPDLEDLDEWINEGLRQAHAAYTRNKSQQILKKSIVTLTAGETEVVAPVDLEAIHAVFLTTPMGVTVKADKIDVDAWPYTTARNTEAGSMLDRYYYTLREGYIHIVPAMAADTDLEVWHWTVSTELTSDKDAIELPDLATDAAAFYAQYTALASTGDPDYPDRKAAFQEAIAMLEQTDARRQNEIQQDTVEPYGSGSYVL